MAGHHGGRIWQGQYRSAHRISGIKENEYDAAIYHICWILQDLYIKNRYLLDSDKLSDVEKQKYKKLEETMSIHDAAMALHQLSDYLCRYYGKKVIILLDEYDTPLQEAYVSGYWDKMVSFIRTLFNNTFKTNPHLDRAMMTGITNITGMKFATQTSDVSANAETLFSDLNNLKVVPMTSGSYASCFGFTEEEVFTAMDEFGMTNKDEVKHWYDGFTIGNLQDIYNPWSITNFLDKKISSTRYEIP